MTVSAKMSFQSGDIMLNNYKQRLHLAKIIILCNVYTLQMPVLAGFTIGLFGTSKLAFSSRVGIKFSEKLRIVPLQLFVLLSMGG